MAESETGLTDLMNYLDLEDVNNTDYDRDIDAEIINVLYYQDVAFMNDNFVVNKLKTCFDRSREKSLMSIKSNNVWFVYYVMIAVICRIVIWDK